MTADYAALAAELQSPDLDGLSDAEAAETLNADTVTVPIAGRYLFQAGVLSVLGLEEGVAAMEGLKAAAAGNIGLAYVVEALQGKGAKDGVDFGDPQVQGMLDMLATGGVISAEAASGLKAYGSRTITRAEAIAGWGLPVSADDVAHARSQ